MMKHPHLLRRSRDFCLRRLQGLPTYRRAIKRFRPSFEIAEADEVDLQQVWARFSISGGHRPSAPQGQRPEKPVVRENGADATRLTIRPTNLVAKAGRRVIGFVQLVQYTGAGHLYTGHWLMGLQVDVLYRGQGVGEALSQAVVALAAQEGADKLSLLVYEDNRPAISLYRKLGFETTAMPELEDRLREEKITRGRRRVAMVKSLTDR